MNATPVTGIEITYSKTRCLLLATDQQKNHEDITGPTIE